MLSKLVALFTSCGARIIDLIGVLALGVVDRGVPGLLLAGEVIMLDAWLDDAPLIYPLVLEVQTDMIEVLPEVSPLQGAGSSI